VIFFFFFSIHHLNSLLLIAGLLSVDCSINRSSELLGFRTFSIIRYSRNWKTRRFGKCIFSRPQVRGEMPTQFGPLERANLNHWTTPVRFTHLSPAELAWFQVSKQLCESDKSCPVIEVSTC
jgi:hypothetical protein